MIVFSALLWKTTCLDGLDLEWQVANFLYVVRGFTTHMEAPCAVLQTGQVQIHNRPPGGLKPRANAIQQLEVRRPVRRLPRLASATSMSQSVCLIFP